MKVPQAAGILGISVKSAFRGIEAGEIPHLRVGRRILVPTAGLRKMLQIVDTPIAS